MINSEGIDVPEIKAEEAAFFSNANPYNNETVLKADIMTAIRRNAFLGQHYWTKFMGYNDLQLLQTTIDWLVNLGYQVYHSGPMSYGDPNRVQYAYTIYWAYPPDALEPFAPGEKFFPK